MVELKHPSKMKRLLFFLFFIAFLTWYVEAQTKRIISIAPSFTEILYALGMGPQIIATSNFCDYPPEALKTEKVGDVLNPNIEKIIRLKPDLVLCGAWKWSLPEKLRAAGIEVLEIKDAENLNDSLQRIIIIGQKVGKEKEAHSIVEGMKKEIETIKTRAAGARRKVYIELDAGQWTVGGASYLNEVAEIVGLENIFHDRKEPYLMVTMESILMRAPDVIMSLNRTKQEYQSMPVWQAATCVRDGKIIDRESINWNAITHQSPRLVEGIQILETKVKEILH
jgi:iron complex transport system substrate-binding protein